MTNTMTNDSRKYDPIKYQFRVHSGCILYGITRVGARVRVRDWI